MNSLDNLPWIRRFYRAHLARYLWAQWLKRNYLNLRLFILQLKHALVWRLYHSLHAGKYHASQRAHKSSWKARYFANQKLESVRFNANQALHKASWNTRHFAFWFWGAIANSVYLFCLRLLRHRLRFYSMRGFGEYSAISKTVYNELAPEREISLVMPRIHPEAFRKFFQAEPWSYHVPAIRAFEITKAQVLGKSDLLFLDDQCLHHELYRFDRDFLFEEMHGVVSINETNRKLVRFKGTQVGSIPFGISLVGSATANYVHWLTETLPKLAMIDGIEAYQGMPYIIDAGLHPNILESVRYLNSSGRNIIQVRREEMLAVDKLVVISPVAYVPFDFKPCIEPEKLDIKPSSVFYSPDGLQQIRQLLVARLGEMNGALKRRLFLRRTGKSRPMANYAEVEALVQELGFEVVDTETLSFAEQVRLFSSAELVASQGGAALGNIIFAPAGCHVIVLTTWSPYTIHYYFANLASILGHRCTLIMCEPVQSELGPHHAHMGVNVSIPSLIEAIHQ